eukprot:79855_1
MVLLSTLKHVFSPEQPFEKGHPVQLLLYLFNQFNQEAVLLLLNQIETILPPISKQSIELTQKAERIFDEAFETHQQYQHASAEEKEMIELDSDDNTKEWMNAEQFRLCDLYFRKASKLSPKCIKCRLKHLKFLMQCKKTSLAEDIYDKTLSTILQMNAPKIENLIRFYYAYLHYMEDDIESFDAMLSKCLEEEPNNIGMRCQYVVCLSTAQEYEKAYIYLIETLKLLPSQEEDVKHYRVVCGVGCAAIRCVFGVDWSMVAQHLRFVVDNDESNIGVIKYCLSYALHRDGQQEESNQLYHQFVAYIENKQAQAEARKKKREPENKGDAIKDAAAELTMDFFKWKPAEPKDNKAELLDLMLDMAAVCILVVMTYSIAGYTPHIGNGIMDWLVIVAMLIVSCALVTPSLGILLMAVTLPPYHHGLPQHDFNHFAFATRWLCVSAGLLFVYRVVVGGKIPTQRLF